MTKTQIFDNEMTRRRHIQSGPRLPRPFLIRELPDVEGSWCRPAPSRAQSPEDPTARPPGISTPCGPAPRPFDIRQISDQKWTSQSRFLIINGHPRIPQHDSVRARTTTLRHPANLRSKMDGGEKNKELRVSLIAGPELHPLFHSPSRA